MPNYSPDQGFSTIVNHAYEGDNPKHAHISPIFMTSTFAFPDVQTGADILSGKQDGYSYTRTDNPNARQLAAKYALLEGIDLLKGQPERSPEEIVRGRVFSSGMAAISSAILGRVRAGETIITQRPLYGNAFRFLNELAPRFGINVVWVESTEIDSWEAAFKAHPDAVVVYTESPTNPTMEVVDLRAVAEIAHGYGAWAVVDNTFSTPYCMRPLAMGYDVVLHSATKYLSGHGLHIGGAVISTHVDFFEPQTNQLFLTAKLLGGSPSPFDAWLANIGLKTFELRMQRHCENAKRLADWLSRHPKISKVNYPGLESHPGHALAKSQMHNGFGGMMSFELKGGYDAGVKLLEGLKLITLAVSLGNVDSLIQHPSSMTHSAVPREERLATGLTDGLVRFSVGIENTEDLIADLDQALEAV
jgi:methionine-gamma-lyase